jgi:hypothetical protein
MQRNDSHFTTVDAGVPTDVDDHGGEPRRRGVGVILASLALAFSLAACGDDDGDSDAGEPDDGGPVDGGDAGESPQDGGPFDGGGCLADDQACTAGGDCCSGHCLDLNGTNIDDSAICVSADIAEVYVSYQSSLHRSPRGMRTFYEGTTEEPGFAEITGTAYDDLACNSCHAAGSTPGTALLADGTDVPVAQYEHSCMDCHADPTEPGPVADSTCLGCHSRQRSEIGLAGSDNPTVAARFSDVHRDAATPMGCTDCHSTEQLHGDGVERASMLEWRPTTCEGCHSTDGERGPIDMMVAEHSRHAGAAGELDCASCHVETVSTCFSCHFETEIEEDQKRFFGPPPLHGFVFLANDDRPGGSGQVTTANFQSLTYQDDAFVAFAPYFAHTISEQGRTCGDCHDTAATQEYEASGSLSVTTWTAPATAGEPGSVSIRQGAIPLPPDWRTSLDWAFVGSPTTLPTLGDFTEHTDPDGADFQQLYLTPLTNRQMNRLAQPRP